MSLGKFIFSKQFVKNLGIAALLTFLIVGGLWFYLKSFTMHNDHVVVPNLKGKSLEETQSMLEDLELTYSVIDSTWNRDYEGGTVKEQIPDAQSEVKRGREIYLTTYRNEPDEKIITIKEGDDQYVAKIKLGNMGVDFDVIYEANELLAGRVLRIEQNNEKLPFGAKIKPGSSVNLYVGERREEKVEIPDLMGMSLKEAEKTLQLANLSLGYPFYDEVVSTAEDSLNAKVYMQSPKSTAGAIKVGSGIDVWLSTIPLFYDENEDDAQKNE